MIEGVVTKEPGNDPVRKAVIELIAENQAEGGDYTAVSGLSSEMKQTLSRVRPQTLGQASRIAGVTPAAVSLIHVYIEIQGRERVA